MIRRRRPAQETAFSFDSFLDLVTNIVGIIIRLILVVWVGAQGYNALPDVGVPFVVVYDTLWTEDDAAIFAGIISFYFGARAMNKVRGRK